MTLLTYRVDADWVASDHMTSTLLCFFLCVAACFGCSDDSATIGDFTPDDPACASDSECEAGQTCQLRRCVFGTPNQNAVVDLYVSPLDGGDTDWTQTAFPRTSIVTAQTNLELTLSLPSVLNGRVQFAGGDGVNQTPFQASVFLLATEGIGGQEFQTSVTTNESGEFSVRIPPGDYTVTVIPTLRDDIPERSFDISVAPGSQSAPFIIDRPGSFLRWQGRVVHQTSNGILLPIPNATVYAISETTGTLSTQNKTNDSGVFTLFVDPNEGPFSFQVRPPRSGNGEDELFAIPTASFVAVDPIITSTEPLVGELPGSGDLVIGLWDQAATIRGTAVDENGDPVVGVRVVATTSQAEDGVSMPAVALKRSTHTYRTSSDEDGRFALLLLQGYEYELRAASRQVPFVLSDTEIFVADAGTDDLSVTMFAPSQREIVVQLPTRGAEPAVGVSVTAIPLTYRSSPIASYGVTPDSLQSTGVTDDSGTLMIDLFSGSYQFRLEASATSGIATTTLQNFVGSEQGAVTLAIANAGVIQGKLSTTRGNPVSGATVEAYFSGSSQFVGRATSSADGRFSLVLPTE